MPKRKNQLRKLGRVLHDARRARNLRLREVAAMIGCSSTSLVHGYESGAKEPPALRLLTIARVLGIDLDDLATRIARAGRLPRPIQRDAA